MGRRDAMLVTTTAAFVNRCSLVAAPIGTGQNGVKPMPEHAKRGVRRQ